MMNLKRKGLLFMHFAHWLVVGMRLASAFFGGCVPMTRLSSLGADEHWRDEVTWSPLAIVLAGLMRLCCGFCNIGAVFLNISYGACAEGNLRQFMCPWQMCSGFEPLDEGQMHPIVLTHAKVSKMMTLAGTVVAFTAYSNELIAQKAMAVVVSVSAVRARMLEMWLMRVGDLGGFDIKDGGFDFSMACLENVDDYTDGVFTATVILEDYLIHE